MEKLADISRFETLQNQAQTSSPQTAFVANWKWPKSAEKKWLEWAYQHPELVAYANRLAGLQRIRGDKIGHAVAGALTGGIAPAVALHRTIPHKVQGFERDWKNYYKNNDYQGFRDLTRDKRNLRYYKKKSEYEDELRNMAEQELFGALETYKIRYKPVASTLLQRLYKKNLLTERELLYLGRNLNEIPSVISWIHKAVTNTGQFRGSKFSRQDLNWGWQDG